MFLLAGLADLPQSVKVAALECREVEEPERYHGDDGLVE